MPSLKTYTTPIVTNDIESTFFKERFLFAYPELVVNDLTIKSSELMKSILVYNSMGAMVKQQYGDEN